MGALGSPFCFAEIRVDAEIRARLRLPKENCLIHLTKVTPAHGGRRKLRLQPGTLGTQQSRQGQKTKSWTRRGKRSQE
jgi:hypothetical protein